MQHRPRKKSGYQATTYIAVALLLLILFVSGAYFFIIPDLDKSAERERLLADLQANRERWETSRPASYRYIVDRACDCSDAHKTPYVVVNRRGHRHAQYVSATTTAGADLSESPPDVTWLDDMFRIAAEAAQGSDDVEIRFDPRFGYVSSLSIERSRRRYAPPDVISIRDFEIIEYD